MTCLSCIIQKHMTLHVNKIHDNCNKNMCLGYCQTYVVSFMLHAHYIRVPIARLCDFDLILLFKNMCVMLCVFI